MKTDVTIDIENSEGCIIQLTLEEARELQQRLNEIFGVEKEKEYIYVYSQFPIVNPYTPTYPTYEPYILPYNPITYYSGI
jgi:hypothetical protein